MRNKHISGFCHTDKENWMKNMMICLPCSKHNFGVKQTNLEKISEWHYPHADVEHQRHVHDHASKLHTSLSKKITKKIKIPFAD